MMAVFWTLFVKVLPLYLTIGLGYISGKYLHVKKERISPLLIYIIVPIIVFNGVATTPLTLQHISLPLVFFLLCCFLCFLFLWLSSLIWQDATKNILAFTAGTGNTGYFGLPVVAALFGKPLIGLVVFAILGITLYENTVGFFIVARGRNSVQKSVSKAVKLPTLYAFLAGVLVNLARIHFGEVYVNSVNNFSGAYIVLGMMLIGFGMADVHWSNVDIKFLGMAFLAKFVVWPFLMTLIVFLDKNFFNFYSRDAYQMMILLSMVPLAANTVSYATELRTQPEKAAVAVLISTLFALFFIPLMTIAIRM
ncbi:permease [Reticulibacter mediterranei]|uniref:Permease n=1 Tax=Reticulibacter mediterranei TaxID=2778369 RepID=A0A8J3IID0_9CHLR|nr:AEC family transporter [Reticulibacter mediterranei]GHO90186.1 permease [Reticulibacter mediterranei]